MPGRVPSFDRGSGQGDAASGAQAARADRAYLGTNPGMASLQDMAILSGIYAMFDGFLHDAAMVASADVPAAAFATPRHAVPHRDDRRVRGLRRHRRPSRLCRARAAEPQISGSRETKGC